MRIKDTADRSGGRRAGGMWSRLGVAGGLLALMALPAQGLVVPAVRPPTVPQGSARLRISLSAAHSDADVERLLAALRQLPQ